LDPEHQRQRKRPRRHQLNGWEEFSFLANSINDLGNILYREGSKIIAIITGVFSIVLALGYLLLVTLLDFRGEMVPAPQSQLPASVQIQQLATANKTGLG